MLELLQFCNLDSVVIKVNRPRVSHIEHYYKNSTGHWWNGHVSLKYVVILRFYNCCILEIKLFSNMRSRMFIFVVKTFNSFHKHGWPNVLYNDFKSWFICDSLLLHWNIEFLVCKIARPWNEILLRYKIFFSFVYLI